MLVALSVAGCAEDDGPISPGQYQPLIASGEDGDSWIIHRAVIDGKPRVLEFEEDPGPIPPKSLLQVWGRQDRERILVEDWAVLQDPPEPLIHAEPYEPRRIATVIVHWGTTEYTKEDVEERMFGADWSSLNYWAEISYGKETIDADVFGPYEIDYQGCSTDWIAFAARDQMQIAGIDTEQYDQFMYIFPQVGCGWGGLAMLGYPHDPAEDSWYNGSFGCVVRNQEIAHNYGIMHTRFYYCGGAPFGSNCSYEEYGSPYDPMGYGCGHMATPDKHYMGWLEECNVVSASSDGVFNLLPTEVPCNGTQALRVPTFDGRYYYIEYRQRIGFDDNDDDVIEGVLVHVSRDPTDEWDGGPYAYLIDLGDGGFLAEGESYSDPQGGVTFTVDEQHDTHAVVSVVFPGSTPTDPTCDDGSVPEKHGGVWGSLECTGGPFMPDAGPPTVSFVQPQEGAEFKPGDEVEVVVEATDDVLVSSVELYVDDQAAGAVAQAPYTWSLPVIANGNYQLIARASDGLNEAETAISIKVTDNPDTGGGSGGGSGDDDDGAGSDGDDDDGDGDGGYDPTEDDALPAGYGDTAPDGCGCTTTRPAMPLWWLLLVPFVARRRVS